MTAAAISLVPPLSVLPEGPHRFFIIRRVALVIRPRTGPAISFETDRSNVFFARLRECIEKSEYIAHFSCGGLDLDGDGIAALNCFIRARRAMGRMLHPWDRLPHAGVNSRYEFSELCQHLELHFR